VGILMVLENLEMQFGQLVRKELEMSKCTMMLRNSPARLHLICFSSKILLYLDGKFQLSRSQRTWR
jgi:hypothetical protein